MSNEWYVKIGGEEYGPVSFDQLKRWANEGRVSSRDRVRNSRSEPWMPATNVKGLFKPPKAAPRRSAIPKAIPVATPPKAIPVATPPKASETDPFAIATASVTEEYLTSHTVSPPAIPAHDGVGSSESGKTVATLAGFLCVLVLGVPLLVCSGILLPNSDKSSSSPEDFERSIERVKEATSRMQRDFAEREQQQEEWRRMHQRAQDSDNVSFGLSTSQRKEFWYRLVQIEDCYGFGTKLCDLKRRELEQSFGLTHAQALEVMVEAVENDWPMPAP